MFILLKFNIWIYKHEYLIMTAREELKGTGEFVIALMNFLDYNGWRGWPSKRMKIIIKRRRGCIGHSLKSIFLVFLYLFHSENILTSNCFMIFLKKSRRYFYVCISLKSLSRRNNFLTRFSAQNWDRKEVILNFTVWWHLISIFLNNLYYKWSSSFNLV